MPPLLVARSPEREPVVLSNPAITCDLANDNTSPRRDLMGSGRSRRPLPLEYEDTAGAYGPNQSALYVRSARRQWPISLSAPSYLTNLYLSDTGASEMTSLVRSWYQKCCDDHTYCSQTANPRILRTRLVHVIEAPLHLQIIETS